VTNYEVIKSINGYSAIYVRLYFIAIIILSGYIATHEYRKMVSNNWGDSTVITAEGTAVEVVEDFCYLGSYLSRTGNCDKECMIRISKCIRETS